MSKLRSYIHEVIFEAETPEGKAFDVGLLILILLSVLVVSLESIQSLNEQFGPWFNYIEWGLTAIFTLEYLLRIYSVRRPWGYILSFYGLVDLLSILPTFLSLLVTGSEFLIVIRALRLLRVFRIFKLGNYLAQSQILLTALRASRVKIVVFLGAVLASVIIIGSMMYLVEGNTNPTFSNIPVSIYWAVVTITTVGYGDIAPVTPLGQFLSAVLMILGYGIIAVPTGIVSVELAQAEAQSHTTRTCEHCAGTGHDWDAKYCKHCGELM